MILLFTAIFATISIIEDRNEGFLQSVLVSPAPRWAMVLGKVLGGAAIAMLQGLLFLALGAATLGLDELAGATLLQADRAHGGDRRRAHRRWASRSPGGWNRRTPFTPS